MDLRQETKKKEPEELFNDSWFYGNSLQWGEDRNNNRRRTEAGRSCSHSEACTPSSSNAITTHQEVVKSQGKSYEETYESIKKLSGQEFDGPTRRLVLSKAPSMPCSTEMGEDQIQNTLLARGRGGLRRSKLSTKKKKSSLSNLARTPSLPTSLRDHEEDDEDAEFSMGRLIRLASMNSSDSFLLPRTQAAAAAKGAKAELERIKSDSFEEITPQCEQLQQQRCSSAPNSKELLGFKNSEIDIAGTNSPTLFREGTIRRWSSKEDSLDLPLPTIWGGKKSSSDTKEQIKFWARSVASNVRQEC